MAIRSRLRPPGSARRHALRDQEAVPLAVAVGVDPDTTGLLAQAAAERSFRWLTLRTIAELAAIPEAAEVAFIAASASTGSDGADGLAREVVLLFDPDHGGAGPGAWFPGRHRHLLFKPLHPRFVAGLFDELTANLCQRRPDAERAPPLDRLGPLLGSSPAMREFRTRLLRLAGNDAAVLIYGERGTERLQAARLLHRASPRRGAALVEVNGADWQGGCAGRAALLDSERWAGRLASGAGGSLLLDRVADLPDASQMALCRMLAAPAGVGIDVRLLATTDAQPLAALADGRLCRALYWHVARFVLRVPPLRERGQDVVGLAARRVQGLNRRYRTSRWLDAGAREALCDHVWPGNLDELAGVVDRAFAAADPAIGRDLVISAIDAGQPLADCETG